MCAYLAAVASYSDVVALCSVGTKSGEAQRDVRGEKSFRQALVLRLLERADAKQAQLQAAAAAAPPPADTAADSPTSSPAPAVEPAYDGSALLLKAQEADFNEVLVYLYKRRSDFPKALEYSLRVGLFQAMLRC